MQLQGELNRDDVLWLLGSLCGLFRIPFDASLIAQSHPPPYTLVTLHEAARALGIKTGEAAVACLDWPKLPYPLIAFRANYSQNPATSCASNLADRFNSMLGPLKVVPLLSVRYCLPIFHTG